MSFREVSSKEVVCRKNHECQYCKGVVLKGDRALYRVYTVDGHFHRDHTHLKCVDLMGSYPHTETNRG